jgi:hypothetical protein
VKYPSLPSRSDNSKRGRESIGSLWYDNRRSILVTVTLEKPFREGVRKQSLVSTALCPDGTNLKQLDQHNGSRDFQNVARTKQLALHQMRAQPLIPLLLSLPHKSHCIPEFARLNKLTVSALYRATSAFSADSQYLPCAPSQGHPSRTAGAGESIDRARTARRCRPGCCLGF